ncbi:vitelline membrane outer layer protein 1 homolog [Eleutherodactylus coqui]|uniref:vitelline membrane outer layer protein 1 homolog n=1 Tax=Eleutherodactylus coqui TaxID=57060 RepID=UPI00346287E6
MLSKVLALLLIVQTAQVYSEVISVSNGAQWGQWGPWEKCPEGSVATGFSLKVMDYKYLHTIKDDTAVNGIRLHCVSCKPPHNETTITSAVAPWGIWTDTQWCDYGRLARFSERVEEDQGIKDDTAVNNFKFECTDGGKLEGQGLYWGTYGEYSETCKNGICGLQTKVQGNEKQESAIQISFDNTGLNDVRFICCR